MGNHLTVANPYIIDEILSEDEEDDDNGFNYETAYESEPGEQNDNDDVPDTGQNQEDSPDGQNGEVKSHVVSSLVKEVESLLNFLDKEDFESAKITANSLNNGVSIEALDGSCDEDDDNNTKPSLPTDADKPIQLDREKSIEELISKQVVASTECVENVSDGKQDNVSLTPNDVTTPKRGNWTSEDYKVLRKLDRDLTSFEENESRLITDSDSLSVDSHQQPRRRARKSSLPRLKRSSLSKSPSSSDGGYIGCDTCSGTGVGGINNRSRESSLTRSSPHLSRVSGIPRFCYKPPPASSFSTTATSPTKPIPASGAGVKSGLKTDVTRSLEEAVTNCVSNYMSQGAMPSSEHSQRNQRTSSSNPVLGGQNNQSESWEINISDLTGRTKRNKKRSGIPQRSSPNRTPTNMSHSQPGSPAFSVFDATSLSLTDSLTRLSSLEDERLPQSRVTAKSEPFQDKWNMGFKKVIDQRRWNCISRPQYKRSCGISSLVSCWNFLFSTMGYGHLHPLTQEEAMSILGFQAPYDEIIFGPFTGNLTLMRWFHLLNDHFKVHGKGFFLYKARGKKQTLGVTPEMALERLKSGLSDRNMTFVYHCHNHYFCPIGFEDTPQLSSEAYSVKLTPETTEKTWIFIGDTSRKYGPIHCKSWDEICLDLNCESPDFFNIRETWKGVKQRSCSRKSGNNLHCIMCFQAVSAENFTYSNKQSQGGINPQTFILHPPNSGDVANDKVSMTQAVEADWQMDSLFLDDNTEEGVESAVSSDECSDSNSNHSNFDADSLS